LAVISILKDQQLISQLSSELNVPIHDADWNKINILPSTDKSSIKIFRLPDKIDPSIESSRTKKYPSKHKKHKLLKSRTEIGKLIKNPKIDLKLKIDKKSTLLKKKTKK
jgi:hypothetical protein